MCRVAGDVYVVTSRTCPWAMYHSAALVTTDVESTMLSQQRSSFTSLHPSTSIPNLKLSASILTFELLVRVPTFNLSVAIPTFDGSKPVSIFDI